MTTITVAFEWDDEEAATHEWLLVQRYGLEDVKHCRLQVAMKMAVDEAISAQAIRVASKVRKSEEHTKRGTNELTADSSR
jgi:hypothetical protein